MLLFCIYSLGCGLVCFNEQDMEDEHEFKDGMIYHNIINWVNMTWQTLQTYNPIESSLIST